MQRRSRVHNPAEEGQEMKVKVTQDTGPSDLHLDPSEVRSDGSDLLYAIEDVPPWYLCIVLGFQHYLTMVGATIGVPILLAPVLCMEGDNASIGELLSTIFFVSGIVTLLQTSLGVRLPIVQGTSFGFMTPTFAILALEKWQCPIYGEVGNMTNETTAPPIGSPEHRETWQIRIREIQGAIAVSAIVQILIGATGILGFVLRFIGPLTITPTITLIGISLFKTAADFCSKQWWIAIMTMVLLIIFSQLLRNVTLPTCSYKRNEGCSRSKDGFPLFKLFPVILAVGIAWLVCLILTLTNVLPRSPDEWGYFARTDIKMDSVNKAQWFRVPYPFQWGIPTVSIASVFGMLAAILSGAVESVGDYYACAKLSGAPPPPIHAVNRGITVEGIGCVLAGIWGTGSGTTSFSENVGAIGITKVGSRRVVMVASLIMICLGMLGKFGAFFVMIPDPVIGGVFMVVFGMVTAVGLSNLQYVDLNSSRNLFVLGFSCFMGFSLPQWLLANNKVINTGNTVFDQVLQVLFSTSTFVGGILAVVLDNIIPGTPEERGMVAWNSHLVGSKGTIPQEDGDSVAKATQECYDFPFCMPWLRRQGCTRYIPVCPTFIGCCAKPDNVVKSHNITESVEVFTVENKLQGEVGVIMENSKL